MSEPLSLSPLELDALREAGNMGAGRAATALSQMLGHRITIDVPRASLLRLEALPEPLGGPEAMVAAVYFRIHGDAPGRLLLLIEEASLGTLLGIMLGRDPGSDLASELVGQSALKELGNILCSAYINALSDLFGFAILPSVPALAIDTVSSVLATVAADAAQAAPQAILIENRFREAEQRVPFFVFFLPDAGAINAMFDGLARNTGLDPRRPRG